MQRRFLDAARLVRQRRDRSYPGFPAQNTRSQCYYRRMKNVTITLDEKTAAWARGHAANAGMSLSRYVGELLEGTMKQSRDYERAMRQYLSKSPSHLKKSGSRYPRREELHERDRLR
jgi:hypothetical protein